TFLNVILATYMPIFCFLFQDLASTELYTLSLHDALPISTRYGSVVGNSAHVFFDNMEMMMTPNGNRWNVFVLESGDFVWVGAAEDRKSTRLNSSHVKISYAVFCLKKKNRLIRMHIIIKLR